ncbi:branchpoint-bridging protein-like [Solanum verrucosum]|uniref:branchpoint-bridging protein-like n=1 Tax=Solanum verrucosum TaxID=315347 RepID=UPI0020D18664|nr:branchpoint-bridging protein-like [Solanum verrucosum]
MEHIHRETQWGSDKRARYQGSYNRSQTKGIYSYDSPRQRFQQGQSNWFVQATLLASERSQHQQACPSTGQSSRRSDSLPPYRGRVTSGRSASGCFDCGALDHWSRGCPWRGGGGYGQDRQDSRQGTRGGPRGGRLGSRSDASGRGAQEMREQFPAGQRFEDGRKGKATEK